ncbi:MAG TPA: hypothetical protein VF875_16050 [Anaeromyxobacter sp.]
MNASEARFRIADGTIHVYRLFDVADSVDLAAAEQAVGGEKSRLRLEGAQSGTALEFPRPPLHLGLGAREVPLAGGPREARASAHVYDFGVISILYELAVPPGATLAELVPLAEELVVEPTPAIDQAARREASEVARALGPALERPHSWDGLESYQIFFVRRFEEGAVRALDVLAQAPVAELLLGETSEVPLSPAERQEVLSHHFTYLEDDLAVLHWNSALVVEPSGVKDIPDLLEFATAHLLELRYYDALLDRELHRIYDEIEAGGSPISDLFTRRYRRLQRQTAALLLELSEMIERLENAIKIVGDFYLARLYLAAVRRFRLPAWQETVLRKQRLVADVNELIGDTADTNRAELLEIAVIVLILAELLAAVRR